MFSERLGKPSRLHNAFRRSAQLLFCAAAVSTAASATGGVSPVFPLLPVSLLLLLLSLLLLWLTACAAPMLFTRVFFRALLRTDFGERVAVVGSSPALGNWQVSHCHELTTNEDVFPSWFSKEPVYLPLRKPVSYKYVVLDERGDIVRWESCEGNRDLVPTGVEMTVEDDDGLFREQMTSRGDRGVEGDDDVSVTTQDKEETEARNRMLAIQEEEPEIDENDTLVLCALDLPIRVRRVAPAAAAGGESGTAAAAAREGGVAAAAAGSVAAAAGAVRASSAEGGGGGGVRRGFSAAEYSAAALFSSSFVCSSSSSSTTTGAVDTATTSSSSSSHRGTAAGGGRQKKSDSTGDPALKHSVHPSADSSPSSSSVTKTTVSSTRDFLFERGGAAAAADDRSSSSSSDGLAAAEEVETTAATPPHHRRSCVDSSSSSSSKKALAAAGLLGSGSLPTSLSADSLVTAAGRRAGASIAAAAGGGLSGTAGGACSSSKFEVLPSKNALLPALYRLRHKTRQPVLFIGWPGIDVEDETEQQELIEFLRPFDCVPVFPEKDDFQKYLSFCHRFLWPLFHNVLILDSKTQEPFDSSLWACYQAVNKLWADAVLKHSHESDLIWIHDFHLLLAPMHITRRVRKANVGFFLHIPFPSSEIFRCLPCREDILRGMLCADLIGFHLFEYARHFLVACKRLLGLEHHFCRGGVLSIEYGGRSVSIRIGHVHIQYEDVRQKIESSSLVAKIVADIRQQYGDKFIFVAVDRCERLAGLLLKVRAFEKFLQTYPYAKGRVVLIQYAYPTLNYFDDGEEMRAELEELVDNVNKRFSLKSDEPQSPSETPPFKHIDLRVQPVGWEEKFAVFLAGDCFLDTSIRDGLNLNPFEFICCHKDHVAGVILSEFTGCSRALASAIRVNPWKVEAVADAMDRIINLPLDEQRDRFLRDQEYLSHNSTQRWAEENVRDLRRARKPDDFVYMSWGLGNTFRVLGMDSNFRFLETNVVLQAYRTSRHRAFFFDCEGTLAPDRRRIPFVSGGENLFAQGRPPSSQVKSCLHALLKDQKNTIVILSGRDRHLLEEWFSSIKGIGLCAEHGFYFRVYPITGDQWHCMSRQRDFTWKQVALELMLQYVKRTQGSFIENKGSALVFQYRDADPDFGSMQAKDLSNYLSELLFGYPVSVMSGKGYVEVKLRGVNKGHAVEKVLRKLSTLHGDVDFVLCVGDDRSDEDMFAVINAMSEDGDQLSLPEGSGACSSGLYRHPQSKDRICRRTSVSSDEATWQQRQLHPTPHRTESVPVKTQQQKMKSSGGVSLLPSYPLSSTSLSGAQANAARSSTSPVCKKKEVSHFFTCTVGKKPSNARYYLNDTDDVSDLLEVLAQCAEKDSRQLYSSKESGAAPVVAAAAAAGSLAGNVAVQLRKGNEGAGALAGLWMRSALGSAAAAAAAGGTRPAATVGKAGGRDGVAGSAGRGQEPRDGVAPS